MIDIYFVCYSNLYNISLENNIFKNNVNEKANRAIINIRNENPFYYPDEAIDDAETMTTTCYNTLASDSFVSIRNNTFEENCSHGLGVLYID